MTEFNLTPGSVVNQGGSDVGESESNASQWILP
jgi:hypothetical protein